MEPRSIDCEDGSTLEYSVSDREGPVLVCLNAMGLGLLVWRRLLEHFSNSHRVICWKPRGTYDRSRTLQDQVADVERILTREGVTRCRLVTWCSGAKVGIEFVNKHPIASSIVLMNGAYKSLPGLEHLETPFEQTMLKLCQLVARRPALAPTMMNAMRSLLTGGGGGAQGSPSPLDGVAGGRELREAIVEPFESERSTVNYSAQVVDYMSRSIAPLLANVAVPVLLLGGQRDLISSPAMSKAIAARLPKADYVEIEGGTHYCLYENPETVIGLIDGFFA